MTNLKLSNSHSAYSICLGKFYENCYFLDSHHRLSDIQHLSIDFLIPYYVIQIGQTHTHTHTHTHNNRDLIIWMSISGFLNLWSFDPN